MIKIRQVLSVLLVGVLPAVALGQETRGYERAILTSHYDINSVTFVYPVLEGEKQLGDSRVSVWNEGIKAPGRVKTDGFSNTLERTSATDSPFDAIAVGDTVRVVVKGVVQERRVTSIAGYPDEVTIFPNLDADLAYDSNGFAMRYKKQTVYTAAADGWFSVRGLRGLTVQTTVNTLVSTSIQSQLECRVNSNGLILTGAAIAQTSLASANTTAFMPDPAPSQMSIPYIFDECRVGVKVTADAGIDQVTVLLLGARQ